MAAKASKSHRGVRLFHVKLVTRLEAQPLLHARAHSMLQPRKIPDGVEDGQVLILSIREEQAFLEGAHSQGRPRVESQEAAHATPDGHQPPDLLHVRDGTVSACVGVHGCLRGDLKDDIAVALHEIRLPRADPVIDCLVLQHVLVERVQTYEGKNDALRETCVTAKRGDENKSDRSPCPPGRRRGSCARGPRAAR